MEKIIVTRHPATVEWLANTLFPPTEESWGEVQKDGVQPRAVLKVWCPPDMRGETSVVEEIRVIGSATEADVKGKIVYGNLPFHLACHTAAIYAVEFGGQPPRGTEYTAEDMKKAGAHLAKYGVLRLPDDSTLSEYLHQGGFTL